MLYVHKYSDTSPRDDECKRAQYDEHGDHGEHDTRGFVDTERRYRQLAWKRGSKYNATVYYENTMIQKTRVVLKKYDDSKNSINSNRTEYVTWLEKTNSIWKYTFFLHLI